MAFSKIPPKKHSQKYMNQFRFLAPREKQMRSTAELVTASAVPFASVDAQGRTVTRV